MIKMMLLVTMVLILVIMVTLILLQGKQKRCGTCGYPLREGWSFCPKCGNQIEGERGFRMETREERKETWKICGLLIGIPVFCYILISMFLLPIAMSQNLGGFRAHGLTMETFAPQELESWFVQWTTQEDEFDGYVLRQDIALPEEEKAEYRCSYVIYIDSEEPVEVADWKTNGGKAKIKMRHDKEGMAGYIIAGWCDYTGTYEHQIKIDGETLDLQVETVDKEDVNLYEIIESEIE